MDQSLSLISAQVQFMEDHLALVHIPLDLYPFFLKPILQVLFHEVSPLGVDRESTIVDVNVDDGPALEDSTGTATPEQPAFLNISITPVECSVMCPRKLADQYFAPLVKGFRAVSSESDSLSITRDDFIAMQVYGEGLEAGQRVLELTSPLAMAGISIFFVSTYFSDYIIVPYKSKTQVIEALENRGFQFEISTETFANSHNHSQLNRCFSPVSSRSPSISPPSTPPPSTLDELQTRTFTSLHKNHILPSVDRSLRLVQCAAHRRYTSDASSISILREALTTTLLVDNPRFLSLTLTAADPAASLLVEKRLLPRFFSFTTDSTSEPNDDETSLLLGSKEDILVPIMLDLRKLPLEATGIVCGVASRLAEATHSNNHDSRTLDQSTNASTSTTSIAALSSNSRSTLHSSFSDSYIKNFFSSNAGSINGTPSSVGNGGPVRLPYTHANTSMPMHRLQPDFNDSVGTAVEISFLSTARAGTILVGEYELTRAVDALEAESREQRELEDGLIQGFEE